MKPALRPSTALREPVVVGVGAAILYLVSAHVSGHGTTPDTAYFNQLADAFVHARVHLENPSSTHDLTMFEGNWYVPFPPMTAVLMMPLALIFGAGLDTIAWSAAAGGVAVGLFAALLGALHRSGLVAVPASLRRWLTAAFALGTIQWYVATQGTVWFLAHLTTIVLVLLAARLAVAHRPALAGAALGFATLSRPTALFLLPFVIGLALAKADDVAGTQASPDTPPALPLWRRPPVRVAARAGIAAGAVASLLLVYNWMRFGRLSEFGYAGENVASNLQADLDTYGQFNLHFIGHNVWAMLLAGPQWFDAQARMQPDPYGMSILLTTPLLVYTARARRSALTWWCWGAMACVLVPLLTYYNTGWYQFGFRFSMDFLPVLLVLVAIGLRGRMTGVAKGLTLLGVAVNLYGMLWFNGAIDKVDSAATSVQAPPVQAPLGPVSEGPAGDEATPDTAGFEIVVPTG